MQEVKLDFLYKGERNYVHGTDMYEKVVGFIGTVKPEALSGSLNMVIHDIIYCQCKLLYSEWTSEISKPENSKAELIFISDKSQTIVWLVETESLVVERYKYCEEDIFDKCSITGETITIDGATPYLAIEVLVAMNKFLHTSLFPNVDGKWFFTRLALNRLLHPDDTKCFSLKLVHNLWNRLTKSQVISSGQILGNIYFSLVAK